MTMQVSANIPGMLHHPDCWHFRDGEYVWPTRDATREEEMTLATCFHCNRRIEDENEALRAENEELRRRLRASQQLNRSLIKKKGSIEVQPKPYKKDRQAWAVSS